MATTELQKLKSEFLEYLEIEKGRSVETVENYDRYLTRYLGFSKITSPTKITEQSVREFRLHLNRQAGTAGTAETPPVPPARHSERTGTGLVPACGPCKPAGSRS